ncbi:hypothetical protein MRX96_032147 [Rhipicephalus microplus]
MFSEAPAMAFSFTAFVALCQSSITFEPSVSTHYTFSLIISSCASGLLAILIVFCTLIDLNIQRRSPQPSSFQLHCCPGNLRFLYIIMFLLQKAWDTLHSSCCSS